MLKINISLFFSGIFSVFIFESSALNITNCTKTIAETVCSNATQKFCTDLTSEARNELIREAFGKCMDTEINEASKVFEWVSIATAGVSFGRWIAAKCFRSYRFVTLRNKLVRFLSKEEVSQGINIAAIATAAVSLSGALDNYGWWFWGSKVIESLPLLDLAPCLTSDLLYLLPHDREDEKNKVRKYLRSEGDSYNNWANEI